MPLLAQVQPKTSESYISVCNQGSVPAEVVVAIKTSDFPRRLPGTYYWSVQGTTVAPHDCTTVRDDDDPAYVAFGFNNAHGEWGSGRITQVPDLGSVKRSMFGKDEKVITAASKTMCVRKDATLYAINDELSTDCATMTVKSQDAQHGHGAFFPLTSALYFYPTSYNCGTPPEVNFGNWCSPAEYDLNISPDGSDRELHATPGSKSEASAARKRGDDAAFAQLVQKFGQAMAEQKQREAQAAADARTAQERRLRQQAAAREEKQRQILAADAAGDPNVKVEAQMIRRDEEDSRQRWAGAHHSPAEYDVKWMGQNVSITGIVSRVEIDQNGSPQWVTIYFNESPDATFVVCSPYADVFQERVGLDLSALVGKTFEAAGQVESPYCGPKTAKGSIRVVESKQWKVR
jgi:hypothetical protein